MEAALTNNEASRLEILREYQIMDTPEERDFDDLVKLAAEICQMPISLVSLVDRDRQWFKGRYGLDTKETPRRISFCAHSILRPDEVTEISDATKDPRFARNELVTGKLHVRAYTGVPLVTPEGEALGTLCVLDTKPRTLTHEQREALKILSRQVMTQLELRRRVAQLERYTNDLALARKAEKTQLEELEAFSYSLSHDLKGPLRAINSFVSLALQRGKFEEPVTDYLNRALGAANRIDQLIKDVLALSQVSRKEMRLNRVDVDAVISSILAQSESFQQPHAKVQVGGPLGHVLGDEISLTQSLTNLLENAVKYVRPGEKPNIRIYSEHPDQSIRIVVADNGIGIPPQEQQRIFGMFQRLHSPTEYEGTGIGLAIVKRAVERMGGKVGVDSQPGSGSHFWIELRPA